MAWKKGTGQEKLSSLIILLPSCSVHTAVSFIQEPHQDEKTLVSCPLPDTRTKPWPFSSCPRLPGQYACKDGRNSPCLVYVTFNQKIYVYWEVQLERMESTNLLKLLEAKPEYHSLLQELGVGECQQSPCPAPGGLTASHQSLLGLQILKISPQSVPCFIRLSTIRISHYSVPPQASRTPPS